MARSAEGKQKDIFEVLTKEHRLVSAIIEKIERACDEERFDEARQVFEVMKQKLSAHAAAEEEVVYPAWKGLSDELKDLMGEADEEHKLVKDKLEELTQLDASDETWKAKLTVLKELVEHHVEEEEGEIFAAASDEMEEDEAIELAAAFLAAKPAEAEELTPVDLEVMTKEDLLDKARERGLEGTSRMTKEELAEALNQGR
ncbi:MAG TPA: hemerythrin domain-containing protein [Kofleriaceae bacterium]|nr:hemerythrin domain-containing protein [Kofleriaceae bacterium]